MRTDYDLKQHTEHSGQELVYNDNGDKFVPHVVETAAGVGRRMLAVLAEAYDVEQLEGDDSRVVMHFAPHLAPVKVAFLPLVKKDGLAEATMDLYRTFAGQFNCVYDQSGRWARGIVVRTRLGRRFV